MFKTHILKSKNNGPLIYIVGCVHGDEPIGKLAIEKLKKTPLKKGTLVFLIAHTKALQKRKRYIESDLNRSFTGGSKTYEERLAQSLKKELAKADIVIDIHATNSYFKELIITTSLSRAHRKLMAMVPIRKVMYAPQKVFGGHELISSTKLGIALEYGPDKTGRNHPSAVRHVRGILRSLGVMDGKKTNTPKKELFTASEPYKVGKKFEQYKKLRDFLLIKKGDLIGHQGKKALHAKYSFYPVFLGKGRYPETLAIAAKSKRYL